MSKTVLDGFTSIRSQFLSARTALRNNDFNSVEDRLVEALDEARPVLENESEPWQEIQERTRKILDLTKQRRIESAIRILDRQVTQLNAVVAHVEERKENQTENNPPPEEKFEHCDSMSLLDLRISQLCQRVFNDSAQVSRSKLKRGLVEIQQLVMGNPLDESYSDSELLRQHLERKCLIRRDEAFAKRLCRVHTQPQLEQRLGKLSHEQNSTRLAQMTNALLISIEEYLNSSPDPISHFHVAQTSWLVALHGVFLKVVAPSYAASLAQEASLERTEVTVASLPPRESA